MRRALPGDIATLVTLMAEFYAESDYGLDQQLAEKAFAGTSARKPRACGCRLSLGLRLNAKPELSRDRTMRSKLGSINRRPFGASLPVR